ncbi:tRNA (carboxymethyluridine(34)-5-O)-methyltransferase [Trichomonascus vanleenenianus]|uniref:tRNA (carboxymethyluridine(34)-5-O)-methyltransferase n=1 Tax=Trichomonascus vanleenenianus TaxID=2268995 RepID=UPI003ECAA4DB
MSDPVEKEEQYVHQVYQEIASHFSNTRYKPWPIVEKYLKDQAPGSIGLDIGCGNGKYLNVNKDVLMLASDRSSHLVEIAQQKADSAVADALALPFADGRYDFAISIAVIHHFTTPERRIAAVKSILGTLNATGTALIYVWALEQKNSRRGWDEGMNQDVLVPWVTKSSSSEETYQRYYHLYKEGELESDIKAACGSVIASGYEKDNWWAIAKRQ